MKPLSLIVLAIMLAASSANAKVFAVTLRVVVLDSHNRSVNKGDAVVLVRDGDEKHNMKFYPSEGHFEIDLPNCDSLDLCIRSNAETQEANITGLAGERSQTIYLRSDRLESQACSEPSDDGSLPSAYQNLLDDLTTMFPNGIPSNLTNIRQFVSRNVSPLIEFTGEDSQEIRESKETRRNQIIALLKE